MHRLIAPLLVLLCASGQLLKADDLALQRSDWHGFAKQSFQLEAKPCFVVEPKIAAPGRPWIWRTSFPDYHPEVDLELLHNGYHVLLGNCFSDPGVLGAYRAGMEGVQGEEGGRFRSLTRFERG